MSAGIYGYHADANRRAAIALHERNVPDDEIASIVRTDVLTVKQWIYQ